jgi:cellulose synthase/poly-beta-1,6-N-acetylglucosamine synthase-like glycosyltransferase
MSLISVLTPVYNPDPVVLDAMIQSVVDQTYGGWQLCLVDDASTAPGVAEVLGGWAARDSRIALKTRASNGGICRASQDALDLADGDLVALLDHDDLLAPEALASVNHAFHINPELDVVYTDEDKITVEGRRSEVFHKPGWSPTYLEGCMYFGHLTAYRTSLVRSVGGFRVGFEGSQDWDLALRATEQARAVGHLPELLYHWRVHPGSVAMDLQAKPWAVAAARAVVESCAERRLPGADVEDSGHPGWFVVRPQLQPPPPVSVVVPTGGTVVDDDGCGYRLVDRCLEGLLGGTDYPNVEVVVVVSQNAPPHLERELPERFGPAVTAIRLQEPFNYSHSINAGVLRTATSYLCLLNDDTEPLHPDWLLRLVEVASRAEVGVVGAQLLYPTGQVQHAGVTHLPHGLPYHPHAGRQDGFGYFGEQRLSMRYLAVTGACQVLRRAVFDEIGGYDPELALNYNDIDFCLRAGARGYQVVQVNAARLTHHESVSRRPGVHSSEQDLFLGRWGHLTRNDPYYRAPMA